MKPTLNEEIEMSAKGIESSDSVMPTRHDCINAIKHQIYDEYISPGERGIYAKDEKGEYFLLRKERFVKDPYLKPKTSNFPKIIFTFMVISIVLWIIAIIKIIKL